MTDPRPPDVVREYWAMLHKRRGQLALCVGGALLTAALVDLTSRPVYQANARILVEAATPDVLFVAEAAGGEDVEGEELQTQAELLRSRSLAELALERLGERSELLEEAASPLDAFRSRLGIEIERGTRLLNVSFRAHDASLAAEAANLVARLCVEQWLESRYAPRREAATWLSERVREARRRFRETESALQRLREKERLRDPAETLSGLGGALLQARMERLAKGILLGEMTTRLPVDLLAFPTVIADPFVRGLRAGRARLEQEDERLAVSLGERHPRRATLRSEIVALDEQISGGVAAVVQAVEADHRTAVAREARLAEELRRARQAARLGRRGNLRLAALEREAESRRQVLAELLRRDQEARLESLLRTSAVRIVDTAEAPLVPVEPRRERNYRLALVLGLGFGIFLCVFLEKAATSVRTPEDVTAGLGLPFLGLVPKQGAERAGGPVVVHDPRSPPAEAWRVVRTNVLFSIAEGGGRVVLVTSARPAEGKTTAAANLAAALAQNGARVLALDADLRRPSLHAHFDLKRRPGLTEALAGRRRLRRIVRSTRIRGLKVLPAGAAPENPAELLGSGALQELLAAQRGRYDWIVLDAPPLLALADAAVLSPLADGVVLVAGAEEAGRAELRRAAEQVSRVGAKIAGVVLNKVDLVRYAGYYGQYYGEYYCRYYAAS